MKKLRIISEKIEGSNNNYFGRGSFETIIKSNSDVILSWLENLISIQNQITILNDKYECENLQKRNYVRILTKLFPEEYNQFVCLNILLRDIDSITLAYVDNNDLKKQYELLIVNNRLKFPGKHKKFVDFDTYQQFITLYANDLIEKSQDFETEEKLTQDIINTNNSESDDSITMSEIIEEFDEAIEEEFAEKTNENGQIIEEVSTITAENVEENKSDDKKDKDKTNWMNVLLKGI